MAADPADPNFTVIPLPAFLPVPTLPPDNSITPAESTAYTSLFLNESKQTGYFRAMSTAINRAQGAAAASNATWQQKQLLAAKAYAYQLTLLQAAEPSLLSEFESTLQNVATNPIEISVAQVTSYIQDVSKNGFPSSKIAALEAAGFNSTEIGRYQMAVGSLTPANPLSYPSMLTDQSLTGAISGTLNVSANFAADRNGDLTVNCADLQLVKSSFGLRSGQTGFDPRADVNNDGVVNILDLSFVAKQLPTGTVCK